MFMQAPPPPPSQQTPITIFVHGTQMHTLFRDVDLSGWLPPSTQTSAGLHAAKTLDKEHQIKKCLNALTKADTKQFSLESSYVFGWSGEIEVEVRKQAGKDLFDLLKALSLSYEQLHHKRPTITIITHSHGGNILLHMAEQCAEANAPFEISRLILMAVPVQEITLSHISSPIFKTIYSLHSHDDHVQIMDQEWAQTFRSFLKEHPDMGHLQALRSIATQIQKAQINKIGSGRHFGSQNNLIQSSICWQTEPIHTEYVDKGLIFELMFYRAQHWFHNSSRGVMHTEFTTPVFFEKIPFILDKLDTERASQGPLSRCLSLPIDGR